MKLYTEEQVKEIYFKGLHNGRLHIEGKCSDEIELLTPIELPSNEEIYQRAFQQWGDYSKTSHQNTYSEGAIWMRDKIQGGNK
jgi:predicted PP-loop superfamily ATPase